MEKTTEPKLTLIMLIDDTPEDLYINNRILEKYGTNQQTMKFNMGSIAMEYLQTHQNDMEEIPDIIFCDIHMPQMTGFQFLDEYDKLPTLLKSKSKVFMLSSTFDTEDIQKVNINPNVKHFYEKPLSKEVVEKIVNKSFNAL